MAAYSLRPISPLRHRNASTSFSHSNQPFTSFPRASDFAPDFNKLTAQQLFAQAMAKKLQPKRSFWGNVLHAGAEAFRPVEWTFDKLLRPSYGVAEGALEGAKANKGHEGDILPHIATFKAFGHGFVKGFMGHDKHGFGKTLQEVGAPGLGISPTTIKRHKVLSGIAGFGLDVAGDPLTYATIGTAPVARVGEEGAYQAGRTLIAHRGAKLSVEQASGLRKTLEAAGPDYGFRKDLAIAHENLAKAGAKATTKHLDDITIANSAAIAEELGHTFRLPQIAVRIAGKKIGLTPTRILGKEVVPRLPPVGRTTQAIADRRIPLISGTVGGFKKAVGSGAHDPLRQLQVAQRHLSERHATELVGLAQEVSKSMPKLNNDKIISALSYFEKKGGVIKKARPDGSAAYVLSPKRIQRAKKLGHLTDDQIKFVSLWHGYAEALNRTDRAFGLEYKHLGDEGKLYVPHLVTREGNPWTRKQRLILKKAGFSYTRTGRDLTLDNLRKLQSEGTLQREVKLDPFEIMVNMAVTRAQAYAARTSADALAYGFGIPTKIVDKAAITQRADRRSRLAETISKVEKASQRAQADAKQLKAGGIKAKTAGRLHESALEDVARHEARLEKLKAEDARLAKQIAKLSRGKKNPAYSKSRHEFIDNVKKKSVLDEYGNQIAFEPRFVKAFKKYKTIIDPTEDEVTQAFRKAWLSAVSKWKLGVTAVNPGYRIRNSITDFANMWIDGVPFTAMPVAATMATRFMRRVTKGDPAAVREFHALIGQGALAGQFGGDMATLSNLVKHAGSKGALLKQGHALKLFARMAHTFNTKAENWGRLTHYMYRTKIEKLSMTDAVQHVKDAHFDYEDLTPFERDKIKSIMMPFYTWTRKNLQFQLRQFVRQPGRMTVYPKLAMESEQAAGPDKGTIVPDYLGNAFGFRLPVGKHNYLNTASMLGIGSLQFVEGPGQALKQTELMFNPAFKVPSELILNKSFLTGAPIKDPTGHPRTPISPLMAPLMGLIPGANVGKTSRLVGGKRQYMAGADPKWVYALSQFPMSRMLLQNVGTNRPAATNALAGYFGGISTVQIDPQQQRMIAEIQFQNQLKGYIKGLRDEGRYPQAVPHVSKHQKSLNKSIAFKLGG